ncbi:Sugar tr and/or MFS 1 domain containing protein [Asbolus verrucosus]|uniref:Sugar tr and/or MFS 1 domain containing protein n=1 Tax=Asbolus verrucosus TaxID=1661398 RepID=A0A482VRE5_ASBVE|nr:Sugar tr and/or MFS 1 domain containing protein [Asbolus verrucosus]
MSTDGVLEPYLKNLPQLLVALIATLNAIADGMQYGWSAPVLPLLRSDGSPVRITENDETWLESAYLIAGLAGIPVTAYSVDKIGRKNSILLASSASLVAWVVIAAATKVEHLYVARALSGAAGDMAFVATPMYIAEIADEKIRGFLVGLDYLMMLLGVLVIYSIAPFTPYYAPSVVAGVLIVVQLSVFPFMPSSPYYLLSKGKREQAQKSLDRLRRRREGNGEELEAMIKAVDTRNETKGRLSDLIVVASNRKAVIIITVLLACQNFSGYSVMVMNVHTILTEAGSVYLTSETTGIVMSALMLGAAIVCSLCVDKFGRKILLLISSVLTGLCLLALAIYFRLKLSGVDVKGVSWIPVVSVMAFAVTFKLGLGFLPQLIVSELFSNKVKAVGMTYGDAMFIIFGSLSVISYHYLARCCGIDVPLYVFAVVSFASGVFTVLGVPETKGKTLEEIQLMLRGGRRVDESELAT